MAGSSAPSTLPWNPVKLLVSKTSYEMNQKSNPNLPNALLLLWSQTVNVEDIVRCEKIEWEDVQSPDVIFVTSSASVEFLFTPVKFHISLSIFWNFIVNFTQYEVI